MQACSRCLDPLYCPLFLKETLDPQIRINKMVHKCSANYHSSPSGLTSSAHHLIFLENPHRAFLQFSLKTCVSHHDYGKLPNLWCLDYWKMYIRVQKLNRHFYLCPAGKFLLQVLISTPRQSEILMPPDRVFSKRFILIFNFKSVHQCPRRILVFQYFCKLFANIPELLFRTQPSSNTATNLFL